MLSASAAVMLVLSAGSGTGSAQDAPARTIVLEIGAQDLGGALATFADRAGLRLLFPSDIVAGKRSPALSGSFTSEEALARLLAGSGLSYSFTAGNTVTISDRVTGAHAMTAADGSLLLDPIDVTGGGTGGFSADTQYETPASSTYISEEQIERFRGTSPGDFLEGSPGVLVAAKRTSGAVDVNIRGMQGMDRVPVSVDGAQQSNTLYRGYAGVASRTYIDPDFIGGVVIEKGPVMGPDGVGATGGVVRMRTIDADDVLMEGRNFGVRLRGGFQGNSTEPPAHGTRGGIDASLLNKTYAPGTLPENFAFTDGLDRPNFLEPTSGYGSMTAAMRNENFEFVAAVARRDLGNYYAGSEGSDGGHVALRPFNGGTLATLGGLTHFQPGEEVLNTSNDSTSYLAKTTFKFDDGHRLELGFTRYLSTYYEMFPSQVTWLGGPFQEAPSTVNLDTYTGTYTWKPDDNELIDFRLNVWKTDTHFAVNQTLPVHILKRSNESLLN